MSDDGRTKLSSRTSDFDFLCCFALDKATHTFRLRRAGLPLLAMIRTSTWPYLGTGHGTSLGRRERCGSQERGCALSFHCQRVLASSQRAFALIAVERCNTSAVQASQGSTVFSTRHRRATQITFHRIGHRYDYHRKALRAILIRRASFLDSFRDFNEPFLNELRHPRHGIRVDLDSGKHVFVSPVVNLRSRTTQLKLDTAFHQVRDEVF